MHINNNEKSHSRRTFIGELAGTAALLSVGSVIAPLAARAGNIPALAGASASDPDEWFNGIKGKHRMLFDATQPHDVLTFAWPRVFLLTNAATGTPEKDCSVVVVLRHEAMPFALNDALWAKYKFGEMLKVSDPQTKALAVRNPFWQPKPDDYKVPGIGPVQIGINDLQASGVMICVCGVALQVYSAIAAENTHQDPAAVKAEWIAGLLPNIPVMPSGLWAVGRAQEHGCTYCFAG